MTLIALFKYSRNETSLKLNWIKRNTLSLSIFLCLSLSIYLYLLVFSSRFLRLILLFSTIFQT